MAKMLERDAITTKITGSHFTPPQLAQFLAQRIVLSLGTTHKSLRILDPACGDGELLLALAQLLPSNVLSKSELIGIDPNATAIAVAKKRLEDIPARQIQLRVADFLQINLDGIQQPSLFDAEQIRSPSLEAVDVIIANPPYVRTQHLGSRKSRELAAIFSITGRVDLAHAFMIAMAQHLKPKGVLGVIVSNKLLFTKSGTSVRESLATTFDLAEVIDLGDTKLFSAAILPAIIVGQKRATSPSHRGRSVSDPDFVRVYENRRQAEEATPMPSIFHAFNSGKAGNYCVQNRCYTLAKGTLSIPASYDEPWSLITDTEQTWIRAIHEHTQLRIQDMFKVRVGIKTTADEVFIRDHWDNLPQDLRPEDTLLHPLISHDIAARWTPIRENMHRHVLYPHEIRHHKRVPIDLTQYPKAAKYLESHRARLEAREYIMRSHRKWYEIWVPQDPSLWSQPKIVFPDISDEPKFFFDELGCIVDGDSYWFTFGPDMQLDMLFFVQGIANSAIMSHYHDLMFGNKLYSGRRRYLTQYVGKYPLPDPHTKLARQIIALTKILISCPRGQQGDIEKELNKVVARAFGIPAI